MAFISLSGFELGSTAEFAATSGTMSLVTSPVRTGTYALRSNPTTTAVGYAECRAYGPLATASWSVATGYFRFYFRFATAPAANDEPIFITRTSAGSLKFELRLDSAGHLVAYDSAVSLLATGTTVLSSGQWYRIEVKVGTAAGAGGAWEVQIDGTSEISGTGTLLNTNSANARLGKSTDRNGNTVDFFYDDFLLSDSAYPGAGGCVILVPNANGNYQTFTIGAGAGNHYENVDEVPPSDGNTTYLLSTGVIGDAESEALSDTASAGITGTINSVKATIWLLRNAPSASMKVRIRGGSTDSDSAAGSPGSAYGAFFMLQNTDPSTSAAWTLSGLDAAEIGVVENATTNQTRVSQMFLMVDFTPADTVAWGWQANEPPLQQRKKRDYNSWQLESPSYPYTGNTPPAWGWQENPIPLRTRWVKPNAESFVPSYPYTAAASTVTWGWQLEDVIGRKQPRQGVSELTSPIFPFFIPVWNWQQDEQFQRLTTRYKPTSEEFRALIPILGAWGFTFEADRVFFQKKYVGTIQEIVPLSPQEVLATWGWTIEEGRLVRARLVKRTQTEFVTPESTEGGSTGAVIPNVSWSSRRRVFNDIRTPDEFSSLPRG